MREATGKGNPEAARGTSERMRSFAGASAVLSGTEGRVRIYLNDSRIVIEKMERDDWS